MATLQKSILLDTGETSSLNLDIVFQIPRFKYFSPKHSTGDAANKRTVFREKTEYQPVRIRANASTGTYSADVRAIGTLIEENDGDNLYTLYQRQLFGDKEIDIDDISFKIPVVIYNADTGEELGKQELEAFDLYKNNSYYSKQASDVVVLHPAQDFYRDPFISVDDFIFLINKEAFSRLIDDLNIGHHAQDILRIIASGFSYHQKLPVFTLSKPSAEDLTESLYSLFPRYDANQNEIPENVEKVKRFITTIRKHGSSLFDFPIHLSEILGKTIEVVGDLTIVTNETNVPVSSLDVYELSLEYNNGQIVKTLYHNWSTDELFIGNKPIDFKFQIREPIHQIIKVAVKGVNGELLWQQEYTQSDSEIGGGEKIHIRVPLKKANTIPGVHSGNTQSNKKLRGRVVQQGNKYTLNNITILVQGKKAGDSIPRILVAGQTDSSGNFTLPYPYGDYSEAQALVALMPDSPVAIDIRPDKPNETISDDFLYILLVDDAVVLEGGPEEKDDCDCHSSKKAKRLPDQEDLVNSDEYTQDIGGSCVNLTTPNRTLKEYAYKAIVRTSDPDVANYTLEKIQQGDSISFRLTGGSQTIPRNKVVNLQNPIRWQDAPDAQQNLTFYQAVSIATGHILHYKAVFKSDGYSLGDLLYSLPLAPGQKKQIVIFDSSHSLTGAESQTISQSESLSASLTNDRSILDQIGGNISESVDGRSSASTSGVSAGLGLGGSIGAISGVLGVSGGYSNSNSSASQDSSRNISQFFNEQLRQSVSQNADSYRQLNASVVTTVREGQQYAVATEAVANHNHCHALTMMYFEVLRHYAVYQELSAVEECVFVPLLMTNFTYENIYKWKDVLVNHLLPVNSNTYLQPISFYLGRNRHPLSRAFDAIERIQTNYSQVDYPENRYADERMTEITGKINLRVNIPRPKTRFDRILSFPVIKKTITSRGDVDVAGTIRDNIKDSIVGAIVPCAAKGPSIRYETNTTEVLTRGAIFDIFMTLDANYESVPPAQCIRVNFDAIDMFDNPMTLVFNGDVTPTPMDFFAGMRQEKELWEAYAAILGMSLKELFRYFNNNVVADWDRIFNEHIAPQIFERLLTDPVTHQPRLKISPLAPIDLSPQSKYRGGERSIEVKLRGSSSLRRSDVENITITYSSPLGGSSQHETFFNFVTFQAESVRIDYATEFSNNTILQKSLQDDLRNSVLPIFTPLNIQEKRNPRKEDQYVAKQLIQHLNSNIEHYNRMLWFNLDPERRFMLMDGFSIQIYNEFGNPIGYRSLASVIKNQFITVTGNSLVFPVAEGYRVSKSYVVEMNDGQDVAVSVSEALFNHYKPLTPLPPYRISVPNRGVFLEAVQGSCDACEKVKPNSSQDWDKFKTEEPTAIAPVITPTPVVTDWKAVFKEFAQPIVNIQNAPATPTPGAGLAGLSDLMGKAGIFNDVTGLAGNQQNAMQTYLSNQENVKALAEMAKGMAIQEHNTSNSDNIMTSLTNARQSGAITQAQHSDLVSRHLENQIDGGDSRRSEEKTTREAARPSLAAAAIEAANSGRNVTAHRTDSEGNLESVEISSSSPQNESTGVDISYEVPALQQPSSMLCWATAATMMWNWKSGTSSAIPNVLRDAGLNLNPPDEFRYTAKFNANQGLLASEKDEFITAMDMVGEAPASYPLNQYILWLQTYGPLWVTTDSASSAGAFSPHARILTGISGADLNDTAHVMMTFIDPATGSSAAEPFDDFLTAYEQMVTDNPGNLFIQIVHFRNAIEPGEGQATRRSWMAGVPAGMPAFKSGLASGANREYTYWHTGGPHIGRARWETDNVPYVTDRLTAYWRAAFNTNPEGEATTQLSLQNATDSITNRSPWSAAFISYLVSGAGITGNDVFSHSIRHVDFIARAIRNKHDRVYGNPFWGYPVDEYAPEVGDIVARSGSVNYANVVNRSNWNVRRAESHTDVVVEVNPDHIIVVGGNLELDSIQTDRSGSNWVNRIPPAAQVNVSVGKRKIYLDSDGKIDRTKTWEIFNNATGSYESRVQFTGSQSEYFAIIKVRTNVAGG